MFHWSDDHSKRETTKRPLSKFLGSRECVEKVGCQADFLRTPSEPRRLFLGVRVAHVGNPCSKATSGKSRLIKHLKFDLDSRMYYHHHDRQILFLGHLHFPSRFLSLQNNYISHDYCSWNLHKTNLRLFMKIVHKLSV